MARGRKHGEHENHERWLVSYADFITLLFAFFVVMFASSQTDKSRAQQVSAAVREALENGGVAAAVTSVLGGTVEDKGQGSAQRKGPGGTQTGEAPRSEGKTAELLPALDRLTKMLEKEIQNGNIKVSMEARGLVISMREAAFYDSGDDSVLANSFTTIERLTDVIKGVPNPIRLEGHTDSIPISNERFRSNWELSAARAIAMLDLLRDRFGMPASRMAVAGYADTIPLESNDTEAGRARNRRVDLVLLNLTGVAVEPAPRESASHGAGAPPPARSH